MAQRDDTRSLLLDAALSLFARHGYDGVTTRRLSERAGTNIAAIAYHFGGKRELYRATLRQLVIDTEPVFAPGIAALRRGVAEAAGDRARLAAALAGFAERVIHLFLNEDFMRDRAPLILREYALPSEDFDILYEGRMRDVHEAVSELAAAALGCPPDDPEAALAAQTVMGQIVVFCIAREVLFRRLGWTGYTPENTAAVAAVVTRTVTASLGLPCPGTPSREEAGHGH